MAFCNLEWYSQALGKPVRTNVILPDQGDTPYPVLYLLHGLCGGADDWTRHTRLQYYLRHYPMAVVMPDGYRSFYARQAEGPDYHRYMVDELPAIVERHFAVRRDRAGCAIGGLSMGGYGAMRLAFTHPDRYCAVGSHSGAVTIGTWPERVTVLDQAELARIFGPRPEGGPHDVLHLARQLSPATAPAIHIDSGTEDPIPLEQSRELHRLLGALGIGHDYHERPGQHNWDYWDGQIQATLPWYAAQLGLPPAPAASR